MWIFFFFSFLVCFVIWNYTRVINRGYRGNRELTSGLMRWFVDPRFYFTLFIYFLFLFLCVKSEHQISKSRILYPRIERTSAFFFLQNTVSLRVSWARDREKKKIRFLLRDVRYSGSRANGFRKSWSTQQKTRQKFSLGVSVRVPVSRRRVNSFSGP